MIKNIFALSLLTLLASCDAPQRGRIPSEWVHGNGVEQPTPGMPGNGMVPSPSPLTPVPTTPGFENCNITQNRFSTMAFGAFNICQSAQDETIFKLRTAASIGPAKICIFPTTRAANGASTYIGNPQCTMTTANQVISGKLYKDRPGFGHLPLNGVIVMGDSLIPEYVNCMQAYSKFRSPSCPSGPVNPSCDYAAKDYQAYVCNMFKQKYSNAYLDIATR